MITERPSRGVPLWHERTFVLSAHVSKATLERTCRAWSPVLRTDVALAPAERRLLLEFAECTRPVDRWPHLRDQRRGGGSAVGAHESALQLFLDVQRNLLRGLLVEELVMDSDELGLTARCDGAASGDGVCADSSALLGCRRADGDIVLMSDPGRAVEDRGRGHKVQLVARSVFLRRLVDTPDDFFGTMRGGVPYQSIHRDGSELVVGRRRDLYERLAMVRAEDLLDCAVLDLGCNIGMSCQLAIEMGARRATGVDRSELVRAATRLNGYFDSPCTFVSGDLNADLRLPDDHDTVFVFAVLGHLDSVDGILRTIANSRARTVYVETHRTGDDQGALDEFLHSPIFGGVELLGSRADRCDPAEYARSYYRCSLAA